MNRLLSIALVCLLQVSLTIASTYNLRVEVTPGGSGLLNTSGGTYEEGSRINLQTSGHNGYVFKGWYEGETLLSSSARFSYTMPSYDITVQARYEYDPAAPGDPAMPDTATYYSFTAQVSPSGAGSLNTTSGRYTAGAKVNLRANANTGYQFVGWQNEVGETLSSSSSYNYTMPYHDSQLTALYIYDPSVPANPDSMATRYTVTVACKPVGGGTFNTTSETAEEGGKVNLHAYTNTGYRFLRWEDEAGETVSTAQNFYYVMPHGNSKLYGIFEFDPAAPGNPNKNYWNKEMGEVIVDDFATGSLGGAVSSVISGSNRSDVAMITVAGRMNDKDFGIINDYNNCTLLDLSRVTGITQVPSNAFDYTNLESVYLPATIEKIGYRAFYECKQLSSLTVYAMMPPALENQVFTNVPEGLVVYVPASSITQYQDAVGWKDFTILPIQEDIRSISISLPNGTNGQDYAKMWLELTNTKSGQRMHYVMTDRTQYTFANIIRNTTWNVTLRNERGDVFGQIDNVEVKDEDVSVMFASLSKPQSVTLTVMTPDGQNVTSQTQITWMDASGNYIAQGTSLTGLPVGCRTSYRMALPQDLAMAYMTPQQADYVLTDGNNNITCQLSPIPQVQISGKVKDAATGLPLSGATISASQTFGGKYSKTLNVKTDGNGSFTIAIANVPTSLAFAASNYVSQTRNYSDNELHELNELEDVLLKSISGATISLDFTYTTCDGETEGWYSDYNNVGYTLYNKTRQHAISQFNVQYPQIVLLEDVDDGDVLQLTATSRTNAFMPVETTATMAEQKATATFAIVELGKIRSSFTTTGNASVVGSLYDASGKLVKTCNYSNASLTITGLADGQYTLVSMGSSRLFNTIYELAQLPQTGLSEGTDYVQNTVEVKSGVISQVSIADVPKLDESKLYYTGENTSFTVNKPSIVAGNYLTLTGRIDFKPAYATSVSNVNLIVDLPESCSFVENSVMVGNSTSSYALRGNHITIPMARYTDRVRFCIIPTLGGEYAPSAFVQFDLNGETVTQPVGAAYYTCQDLSIIVPSVVAKTSVSILGTAIGLSSIDIYDNDVLIGQTSSLKNGTWSAICELNEPYNLSIHNIHAKVTTKSGLELSSETKELTYDKNAIKVSKVTMINTAHPSGNLNLCEYVTEFDFTNPEEVRSPYWYWPNYPDFTFLIDFTNNDTTIVSNVKLYVLLSDNTISVLTPTYNNVNRCWVAMSQYHSNALPTNVNVTFDANTNMVFDRDLLESEKKSFALALEESIKERKKIEADFSVATPLQTQHLYDAFYETLRSDSTFTQESYELLSKIIDSLGSNTQNESETIEEISIEELLRHIDAEDERRNTLLSGLLDNMLAPDITSAQLPDEYSFSIPTDDGYKIITKKLLSDVNRDELIADGYDEVPMTDNTHIYVKVSNSSQIFIDEKNLSFYEVKVEEGDSISRARAKKIRIPDGSDITLVKCITNYETIVHGLQSLADAIRSENDAEKIQSLLGSICTTLDGVKGSIECIYENTVKQIFDNFNAESDELLGSYATTEKELSISKKNYNYKIELANSDINRLKGNIAEYEKELQRLEEQMSKAITEESKLFIQNEINFNQAAKRSANTQITKLEKEIAGYVENLKEIEIRIADNLEKFKLAKENVGKIKAFLNNIPKSLKNPKALKVFRIAGNIGKVVGTTVGAALQLIPLWLDAYELGEEIARWNNLWNDIWAKWPCKDNQTRYQKFMAKALGVTTLHVGIDVSTVAASTAALVLDATNNPFGWIASLVLDLYSWSVGWVNGKFKSSHREALATELKKIKCDKDDDGSPDWWPFPPDWWPFPPVEHVMDPSGYVYEGVASNRVEGVTATAYYKEMVEDMYGDLHENIVKWDASEYAQENPLFTDEYGMYAWDVPNGLWQVKFEKEGYETAYSEWLPVPPPQLDINIAMKQNRQPEVKLARAFEDAVELEFDKYMMPELLTAANIVVMQNGKAVEGTVQLLNEEVSHEGGTETFASKVRFNAAQSFTEQEITLMVSNRVKSYAGIRMQDDYQQTFAIEQEIKQIANDSLITVGYGDTKTYVVSVLPASASKGKVLTVKTSSPMILGVEKELVTIDNDGKAEIIVSGELPGIAALSFSVEGTDKTAMTIANVEQTILKTVATPMTNIASGSVVEKGTAITLSCATESATIYYTLDGSCPCDETGSRKKYDGTPIIIDESVVVKVMAIAPDMAESDVAEFIYIVDGSDGIDEVGTDGLKVILSPLPIEDWLYVNGNFGMIQQVEVYDMRGVKRLHKAGVLPGLGVYTGSLPTGLYYITVDTDKGVFRTKVLKR